MSDDLRAEASDVLVRAPSLASPSPESLDDVNGWAETMMDALRASDNGRNPFYSDDPDTVQLARELAEAVVARLRR